MRVKCEFCGAIISDDELVCPSCGGANQHFAQYTNEEEEINHRRAMEEKRLQNEFSKNAQDYEIEKMRIRSDNSKTAVKAAQSILIKIVGFAFAFFIIIMIIGFAVSFGNNGLDKYDYTGSGYYSDEEGSIYYYDYSSWYLGNGNDDWTVLTYTPESLNYIGYEYAAYGYNFQNSGYMEPTESNYYHYDGEYYVFYWRTSQWYIYSDGWKSIAKSSVDFDLRKYPDKYSTADWSNNTYPVETSDFRRTPFYELEDGYYVIDGKTYYHAMNGKWFVFNGNDYDGVSEPEDALYNYYHDWREPVGVLNFYDSKAYKKLYD